MYVCKYVCMYICVYLCMYICTYACMIVRTYDMFVFMRNTNFMCLNIFWTSLITWLPVLVTINL